MLFIDRILVMSSKEMVIKVINEVLRLIKLDNIYKIKVSKKMLFMIFFGRFILFIFVSLLFVYCLVLGVFLIFGGYIL